MPYLTFFQGKIAPKITLFQDLALFSKEQTRLCKSDKPYVSNALAEISRRSNYVLIIFNNYRRCTEHTSEFRFDITQSRTTRNERVTVDLIILKEILECVTLS